MFLKGVSDFLLIANTVASLISKRAICYSSSCTGPSDAAFPGVWDENNFSPSSRTVSPISVLDQSHNLLNAWPGAANISGNGSMLIFDFGKEVGGILTVQYQAQGEGELGIAYSEASNFTGTTSDESNGSTGPDGAMFQTINDTSSQYTYTSPDAQQRGGFRYLTLFVQTSSDLSLDITDISLQITFQPTWSNLRAYQGFFHSSDALLNKIWYASAYTCQTTTVDSNAGRVYPLLNTGWENDANLGTDLPSVLVDGAKRDRAIWAGDLGIATRSTMVSTGDLDSVLGSLTVQYTHQYASGELPMVGPPINFLSSDTYHMATLIGTYDYLLFSGDTDFLNSYWTGYQNALAFVMDKIDSTGMMYSNGPNNWGKDANSRGYTTDANMMLYRCLVTGAIMAGWQGDSDLASQWNNLAESVKNATNVNNWDSSTGAFKNKADDASVYPEDGNSMALYYGGSNAEYISQTSSYLMGNWGPIGAVTPELPDNIVPYIESFEIKGHFMARQPQRALDLIRLSWGWMLNNLHGTQSTFLEGYRNDGSFRYRDDSYNKGGAYTSHSHGWSTGPADALTSFLVGLQPTGLAGASWVFEPQFGDVSSAQAGFTTPLGQFSASWSIESSGYQATVNVPQQTNGTAILPFPSGGSAPSSVTVQGQSMNFDTNFTANTVTFSLSGGISNITVNA